MRLEQFEVQAYKNLRAPVRLEQLGQINVVHGDNNVGKSNLVEAIGLLFVLLQALREDGRGAPSLGESFARRTPVRAAGLAGRTAARTFAYFTERGFPPDEIFNLDAPTPIELSATLRLDRGDLDAKDPPWMAAPIEAGARLERREDDLVITLTRLQTSSGIDLLSSPSEDAAGTTAADVLERLGPRRRGKSLEPRFALLRTDRTALTEVSSDRSSPLVTRDPLPQDIAMDLYRAEGSSGVLRQRFDRFIGVLDGFRDLVGEGRWQMRYDVDAGLAELLHDRGTSRVPLRLMGSGIQQIAVLCARLLMTGADFAAIEEPELNLRWLAQHRLREALRSAVGAEGAPSQLLLTSHSPAFEFEPTFYAMSRGPSGPRVARRPSEEAPRFTNPEPEIPPSGARAPVSYVTSEGLVRVPADVLNELGLDHGGGVAFVREKDHGHFRMLSDAQLLDMIEPRDSKP